MGIGNNHQRLASLDGLRGFAALSVFLSHSYFNLNSITQNPFFQGLFKTFSVGPNSVQILFVLCGFLMAFLYPNIQDNVAFIRKRYTRIFPVFIVICIYIWFMRAHPFSNQWFLQIGILGAFGVIAHFLWKNLRQVDKTGKIAASIFWLFISLQLSTIVFNLVVTPRLITSYTINLPLAQRELIYLISNLTLTNSLAKNIAPFSGVFWSLAPEVLFYLIYPVIVLPLLKLSRGRSVWFKLFLIACVTKILFDLDKAAFTFLSLHGLSIGRATGFMMGVIIGSLYQTKDKTWEWLTTQLKSPSVNVIIVLTLLAFQWGDWAIRDKSSYQFINWYYLFSSVSIGAVILAAITPNTLTNKIFSSKLLGYVGLISYSLYLIHPNMITAAGVLMKSLEPLMPSLAIFNLVYITVALVISVLIAALLYTLVEYMYFTGKPKQTVIESPRQEGIKLLPGAAVSAAFIILIYMGSYSPTLLINHHPINKNTQVPTNEVSLLNQKVTLPFTAAHPNLAIVAVQLRYSKDATTILNSGEKPAVLAFRIWDELNQTMVFESVRDAYIIEGEPHFPFGFPIYTDSSNHKYNVELELLGGSPDDQIFVDTSPTSLTSGYTISKSQLIKNPFRFLGNRLWFVATNPDAIFALSFITLILFSGLRSRRNSSSKNQFKQNKR